MSRASTAAKARHGPIHQPSEDPDAPGCCGICHRPMDVPNDRHKLPPADPGVLAEERRRTGDRED